MKKEYGWIDYTNLALNVAQTAQLQAVRGQLAQLQQAHLDERARAEIQDQLRQEVFEKEELLKQLMRHADKNPMLVHLHCWSLQDWFDKTGVSPAAFREFGDKDRVQKTLVALGDAIDDTYKRLDSQSREEVDMCRVFIQEESELTELIDLLISCKEAKVDPNAIQAELKKNEAALEGFLQIKNQSKYRRRRIVVFCLGCVIAAMVLAVKVNDDSDSYGSIDTDFKVLLSWLLAFGVPIAALIWHFKQEVKAKDKLKNQYSGPDFNEIEERCEWLKMRSKELDMVQYRIKELYSKFGTASETEIMALQKERARRITKATTAIE